MAPLAVRQLVQVRINPAHLPIQFPKPGLLSFEQERDKTYLNDANQACFDRSSGAEGPEGRSEWGELRLDLKSNFC